MTNPEQNKYFKQWEHLLLKGKFGLEKENVRVNADGTLALSTHPDVFGDKGKNPYITTDFSESQIEMITPPLPSVAEALGFMETLHDVVTEHIGDEYLWPQSLPPLLPDEKEIPIARYTEQDKELEIYRETIARIYGKHRQLISGIHFNYSLPEELLEALLHTGAFGNTIKEVREQVYLKMVRNFMRYRWILVWLYGESPLAEDNFEVVSLKTGEKQPMKCGVSISLRTGPLGYRNKEEFVLDYYSIEAYEREIATIVEEGRLNSTKELYLPLRMKFLEKDHGAPSYLEVRLLDLDPFTKSGVSSHAIYFSHMLLIYALLKEESTRFDAEEQFKATCKQDNASCYGRCLKRRFPCEVSEHITIADDARELINDMASVLDAYGVLKNDLYRSEMEHNIQLAQEPESRDGVKLFRAIKQDGFVAFHMKKAEEHRQQTAREGYRFFGLEDMEMSTQLLLKAALLKGVCFEIVDRKENFVRLYNHAKEEYVMQATKTSLDNYVSVLMMENKVVTKKVLDKAGIRTPRGREYYSADEALLDFEYFRGKAIVIKPKSTNFGLGISILKVNEDREDFATGLQIAFEHDNTILIEEFVAGREFRFFLIDNEVVGILHRVPANVVGNGVFTIAELIDRKNEDPLRGKGYRTPLEKIRKGREEELFLKQQGLTFDSVPGMNEVVYLRENSNISTGGDSIDFTDEIHPSYKAIAVEAAKAMHVRITGLDMMIPDITAPADETNYAIIEMNFNPAIHIHCYPYKGINRHLNDKILAALGF